MKSSNRFKKVVDVLYAVINACFGTAFANCHCDRFTDGSTKVVWLFGPMAAYAMAPDGIIRTLVESANNLEEARQIAWRLHEGTIMAWLSSAECSELLKFRDWEKLFPDHIQNKRLIAAVQKELDYRAGHLVRLAA